MPTIESGGGAAPSATTYPHGFAHAQGRRPTMEDEILAMSLVDGEDVQLFAVFDGHGGRKAVERIVHLVPDALRGALAASASPTAWPRLTPEALTGALCTVDAKLLAESAAEGDWDDGSTALIVLTNGHGKPLQIAQLGDAQAVLCGAMGVEALCAQHRVGDPAEDARLAACGAVADEYGRLVGNGRGVSATRSLGDAAVKNAAGSGLTAVAQVSLHTLSPADELLILGCDGIWDVMEPDVAWEIATRVGKKRGEWDLAAAAAALVQGALDRDTGDNVSVLCIGLKKPRAARAVAGARVAPTSQRAAAVARAGAAGRGQQPISVKLGSNGQLLAMSAASGPGAGG